MHDFMQSLQMRWPVPAQRGLSTAIMASAAMPWPSRFSRCASEIFSFNGQPSSSVPSGSFLTRGEGRGIFSSLVPRPSPLFQSLGTGILIARMADDAVVHFAQGFAGRHALVGEAEAVAMAASLGRALEKRGKLRIVELAGHQVFEVQLLRVDKGGKLAAALLQLGVK